MLVKWAYNVLFVLGVFAMLAVANLSLILPLVAPTPLVYHNMPFPVSQKVYRQHDTFFMKVEQCSSESTPTSVVSVKEIYSPNTGASLNLNAGSRIIPPGCTVQDVSYASVFPDNLESGVYFMRGVTTFRGKLRTVDIAWQSQPFEYRKE